jgi:uncharacterized membrane protein YfhO
MFCRCMFFGDNLHHLCVCMKPFLAQEMRNSLDGHFAFFYKCQFSFLLGLGFRYRDIGGSYLADTDVHNLF